MCRERRTCKQENPITAKPDRLLKSMCTVEETDLAHNIWLPAYTNPLICSSIKISNSTHSSQDA